MLSHRSIRIAGTVLSVAVLGIIWLFIFWMIGRPNFLPSDDWIRIARLPSILVGLLLGGAQITAFYVMNRHSIGDTSRFPKSVLSGVFFSIFGLMMMVFACNALFLEALPYFLSDREKRVREESSIDHIVTQKMGNGWRLIAVAGYQRLVPIRWQEVRYCPKKGAKLVLTGEGNYYGMHLTEVVVIDSKTNENWLFDFAEGQSNLPLRCRQPDN